MLKREFELTTRDAAFVEECLASGDWTDADEVIQAALTLLRCHDFGEEGARFKAWEHAMLEEALDEADAGPTIPIDNIAAYFDEKLTRILAEEDAITEKQAAA